MKAMLTAMPFHIELKEECLEALCIMFKQEEQQFFDGEAGVLPHYITDVIDLMELHTLNCDFILPNIKCNLPLVTRTK